MRLLVSGATGFVGRYLVPILLEREHQVTVLSRDEAKAKGFDWYPRVLFVPHDILDTTVSIPPSIGEQDAIVHLAWSGLPNYNALYHFERNLPANYHFLKSVVAAGIEQVLVTGTCLEYGMQSGCLSANSSTRPVTPYAIAKDTLRKFLEAMQKEIPFTLQWARIFYLYGKGKNPNSLLAQLDRAINEGESTFNMSGGEQLRDYLPVSEAALQLARLVERPDLSGPVNICSGTAISVRRLIEEHIARRGRNDYIKYWILSLSRL